MITLSAGSSPPAPNSLEDVGEVHVVDGDGTALCSELIVVEAVDACRWQDVSLVQRCPSCEIIMGAAHSA